MSQNKRKRKGTDSSVKRNNSGAYANDTDMPDVRSGGLEKLSRKYLDLYNDTAVLTTSLATAVHDPTTTDCLSAMGTGDSPNTRDGYGVQWWKIDIKGTVELVATGAAAATRTYGNVLIALVQDNYTNKTQMGALDCYKNISGNTNLATCLFRNLESATRFKVLATKKIYFEPPEQTWNGTNLYTSGGLKEFELKHYFGGEWVNMLGTGSTVAAHSDKSLHLIAITDMNGETVNLKYHSRLRFTG